VAPLIGIEMDAGQIVLLSFMIGFAGFVTGVIFTIKSYKTNRFSVVLPGQTWYLPGTGPVKIVHSSEPGSEILYVYNLEDGIETAMGVCSRNDLIKGGFLIDPSIRHDDEEDEEEMEEDTGPDLKVIQFPGKDESQED
jgi:hypothetical protein